MSRRYLKSNPPKKVALEPRSFQKEIKTFLSGLHESLTRISVSIVNIENILPDVLASTSESVYEILMRNITMHGLETGPRATAKAFLVANSMTNLQQDREDFRRKISRYVPDGDIFNDVLLLCIQLTIWFYQYDRVTSYK